MKFYVTVTETNIYAVESDDPFNAEEFVFDAIRTQDPDIAKGTMPIGGEILHVDVTITDDPAASENMKKYREAFGEE